MLPFDDRGDRGKLCTHYPVRANLKRNWQYRDVPKKCNISLEQRSHVHLQLLRSDAHCTVGLTVLTVCHRRNVVPLCILSV